MMADSTQSLKQLVITTSTEWAEPIADCLSEHGAFAVSLEDAKDQPLFQVQPEDNPLWETVLVKALFPGDYDCAALMQNIASALTIKTPHFTIEKMPNKDWVRTTQQQFSPQQFGGQLWVCPAWHDADGLTGIVVKLDPGLAFGTGTHPTTNLCLTWLANHPPKHKTVIDYGCGSGILALAACALGASRVHATDHDPQALEATQNNAALNDFKEPQLNIVTIDQLNTKPVNLVLANILANPLLELAPRLISLVADNGDLILSGILEEEADKLITAYSKSLTFVEKIQLDEWVLLHFKQQQLLAPN